MSKNIISLHELQRKVYEEYRKNGYLYLWGSYHKLERLNKLQNISAIAELGLISTEVSEAIECIRNNESGKNLGLECADIIIRTLNFMTRHNLNAEKYILTKHKINMERFKLHGKYI